jgi:hypothetical protein
MKATLGVFSSLVAGHTARCSLPTFPHLTVSTKAFTKRFTFLSHFCLLHSFLPEVSKSRAYLELTTASRHWTLAFQSEFLISPQAWR